MAGGLLQLQARGAQDQLLTGNPSFTHFRSMYKCYTEFAMEHFRLYFNTKMLSYPSSGTMTLRTKVDRNAQLLSDCYLSLTIPDIYSPVVPLGTNPVPAGWNSLTQAIPYEFQWIRNLGYNLIDSVSVLINGQAVATHTGEWMKLYASLQFDATKRALIDELVGNVPELYDPANAQGRLNQYPSSITSSTANGQASIAGRVLQIPLHFWFCESVGKALPLIALQYSEVEIVVELKNMYDLFTTIDVNPASPTYGQRVAPDTSNSLFQIQHFLSPPTSSATANVVPGLTTWNLNPYIEANYIFLGDTESSHIARTEQAFLITQVDLKESGLQYGSANDLELVMRNLCRRIVWVFQRDDRINDPDNYTNWVNPYRPPQTSASLYSSGTYLSPNISQRDILIESNVILDTKDRFTTKQTEFFSEIQPYKFANGIPIPGVYFYSFQLDTSDQPSGSLNGSMVNKTILRNTLLLPPYTNAVQTGSGIIQTCVLKSTANMANPTIVNPNAVGSNGKPLYTPDQIVSIVTKTPNTTVYQYTFNVRAYTESYNFLRIIAGMANVVFSS